MKPLALLSVLIAVCTGSFGQRHPHKQPATAGIHFSFIDFTTATAIQNSSLSQVIREKQFGKDMSQGLTISYGKGLSNHFDFASTLIGAFLSYPLEGRPALSGDFLLLEADASFRAKMLTDKHWCLPYLQAGV